MSNLELYNQLKEVPNQYLKKIAAGRLKGMSDIKPQWRIQKLTEVLGACGFGWKIQNLKFSYEKVENEVVCNCYLEFLYKQNGEWSEPIPAVGGSSFSTYENKTDWDTKEKTRVLYVSDEAEKMAYTDAISVATKMIGLASDIYMGYGGKYDTPSEPTPQRKKVLDEKGFKFLMNATKEQINEAFETREINDDYKKQLQERLKTL